MNPMVVLIYIYNTNLYNLKIKHNNFTEDVFHIDEVTIYENKFSDNKYALAGDTLDAVSSIKIVKSYLCFIINVLFLYYRIFMI